MCFFLYVVYELLVGLAAATAQEQDPVIKGKIQQAQVWTVVSWCTYPVVYLFPMVGLGGCRSVTRRSNLTSIMFSILLALQKQSEYSG